MPATPPLRLAKWEIRRYLVRVVLRDGSSRLDVWWAYDARDAVTQATLNLDESTIAKRYVTPAPLGPNQRAHLPQPDEERRGAATDDGADRGTR